MLKDSSGQVSLEYILIFTVSLIILMVFTLPLAEQSIETVLDVSDSLSFKSEISKIAYAIKQVYGEGQGSRHSIDVNFNRKIKISIDSNHVSTNLKLKSNNYKVIWENVNSNIKKTALAIDNGRNSVIVEWPMNSENILVYRK